MTATVIEQVDDQPATFEYTGVVQKIAEGITAGLPPFVSLEVDKINWIVSIQIEDLQAWYSWVCWLDCRRHTIHKLGRWHTRAAWARCAEPWLVEVKYTWMAP